MSRTAFSNYKDVKVRSDIESFFKGQPDVSVGDFIPNYFEVMGKSHFCLIPYGTSSWTNHLYTSFFAGCIPIILSDDFILPFQRHLDWKSLTVRWPQNLVNEELYMFVYDFVNNRREELEAVKKKIDEHRCWFDWYNFDNVAECSPYKAIFQELAVRRDQMPKYRSKFGWVGSESSSFVNRKDTTREDKAAA